MAGLKQYLIWNNSTHNALLRYRHSTLGSECWQADIGWCGGMCLNVLPLLPPGQHSVLMATIGTRIRFPAEAGSENWRVPAPRPLFPPGHTWTQTQTMCVLTLWTSTCLTGWLLGKRLSLFLTTFDRRKHSVPPSCHCYLSPPVFVGLFVSVGKTGKWFLFLSSLHGHTPPCQSFRSKLARRSMWLGKYSSLSPGPKVISWYSSCHRLTRSRLEEKGFNSPWQ